MSTLHGYLAFPGYLEDLKHELQRAGYKPKKMLVYGDLVLIDGPRKKPVWARNIWSSVERLQVDSVADSIRQLKAMGLRWSLYPHLHHRRAELILRGLRVPTFKPLKFPDDPMPAKPLGSFMLLSEKEILASARCSQTVPHGEISFLEDKLVPPTRAYLKLWEAFTRIGHRPGPGDACIDLGSCPGGWTWVIARLGAHVVSVDRSEIDAAVLHLENVEFIQGNAFTLEPSHFPRMDWVFSDVICEPKKLLELVERWMSVHPRANFVCSVKFKGETDFKTLDALQRIRGSFMLHLNHNKYEVTWVRLAEDAAKLETS